MSSTVVTPAGRAATTRARLWATRHPIVAVVALYGLSRLWSTLLLGGWYGLAHANVWRLGNAGRGASPAAYLNSWDSEFYLRIARQGYPVPLPVDGEGHVLGGAWAFLPVFPWLTRGLATLTGAPLADAAVIVALLAGGAATVALFHLVREVRRRTPGAVAATSTALWTTALFCFGPLAFLLQVGYAEGLSLFFVFAGLLAVLRRHYLLVLAFGVAAAFTRPGGALALAVALGVHLIVRLVRAHRGEEGGMPARTLAAALVAGLGTAAAGLAWSPIVGALTGVPDAYLQTEMAWWTASVGRIRFVPLTPWFVMGSAYLGWAGPLVVLLALAAGVVWFTRRGARMLGAELLAYGASWCLYLVAVFLPQQSLCRLILLPLAPLAADPLILRHRRLVLAAGLVLQPVAVVVLWSVSFP
ncbi:mannosyltransferase family protein [Frondihabitans cladoniiphilus]|uniref:Mannosyltransferase PIG-V n=1 Tax=Frondihabitans cladoniiphilus TaxID=715785 RepID=A0ABP8W2N8_9MICO